MKFNEYSLNSVLYMQAQLLNLYNNYVNEPYSKKLARRGVDGEIELLGVKSVLDDSKDNQSFAETIISLNSDPDQMSISIEHLIKKMDLTSAIMT